MAGQLTAKQLFANKWWKWVVVLAIPMASQGLIYWTWSQLVDAAAAQKFIECVTPGRTCPPLDAAKRLNAKKDEALTKAEDAVKKTAAEAERTGKAAKVLSAQPPVDEAAIKKAFDAAKAAETAQAAAAEASKTLEAAKKAKSEPDLKQRAADTAARTDLATSSSIVRIAAVLALVFAFRQICTQDGSAVSNVWLRLGVGIVFTVSGGFLGYTYGVTDCFHKLTGSRFIDPFLENLDLKPALVWNLALGYGAVGALLAALCVIVDGDKDHAAVRLSRLQAILALGGALFSAGVAVEADLIDIALLYNLEAAAQSEVKATFESLKNISGLAGATFVTLAVGTAYAFLRSEKAVNPPSVSKALALQDDKQTDLQLVSAIFNILFALLPLLAATFKSTGVTLP